MHMLVRLLGTTAALTIGLFIAVLAFVWEDDRQHERRYGRN